MRLPPQPPADPTNRVADTPAAAELGRRIFSDRSLSPSGRVACISCHSPELVFTNGKDTAAEGVGPGNRNVPSMVLASHARWQLWDGRADSLWAQAVLPFEDATEFGSSRLFVAHAVFDRHRSDYEPIFGPLPPLDDAGRFPANGKPGDAAWEAMSPADREAVTRVLADVGKSIAAFERSLRVKPNALDRYADGDAAALTAPQKAGLRAFFDAGCAQCHHGPRLTDDAFHNLRLPTGRADKAADRGRADGIPHLLSSEFLRSGRFSDAAGPPPPALPTSTGETGAFKTPGLRGVPFTMPYGHGGGFGGLASVIEAHRTGGLPGGGRFAAGDAEPWAQGFDPALAAPIEAFLRTLSLDVEDTGLPRSPAP
jgi:cytochrome c peroxidase